MRWAYYNEIDAYAAKWLRNLIAAGLIADGEVDERSIVDVRGDDLRGFEQCHFFAGIGVWSHALRKAGWRDDEPVWTGSCPCQPFSAAGRGAGIADARHLWPAWFGLIRECGPVVVFGEQVANRDGLAWFDHVALDLEGEAYTVGAVDTCAAGYGAPHIRQRLYFVAHADARGLGMHGSAPGARREDDLAHAELSGEFGALADDDGQGRDRLPAPRLHGRRHAKSGDEAEAGGSDRPRGHDADGRGESGGMGNASGSRHARHGRETVLGDRDRQRALAGADGSGAAGLMGESPSGGRQRSGRESEHIIARPSGPVNGFWSDAEWIACRDGKARPTQSGLFPLAYGVANRVGKLRAYGNAIVAEQAAEFIRAARDVMRWVA